MSAIFGETLIFGQEDGPDVELVVFGDEFYARYETRDGYTVVCDSDVGQFCYAILLDGRFASSGIPITKRPPPGLPCHCKESGGVRNEKFQTRYAVLRPAEIDAAPHVMRTLGPDNGLLDGRRVSVGEVRGLTVLVDFADVTTNITADHVDAFLNAEDYTQNGNFSSVREYFRLISNGKFDYSNRVVGPVVLNHRRNFYKRRLLVEEALDSVVNDLGVDLAEFVSQGDGIVDAVTFLYAGRTLYEGDLWPHSGTISLNYGGNRTHFYMLTSVGRHPVDLSIGTFCHETGHLLCRFPDLYDYGSRDGDFEESEGLGRYCLMGSGNHLNQGRTPSPVCAYLRELAEWTDAPVRLNNGGHFEAVHGNYGTVFKYETNSANEYFIVENRFQLGLDSHLPASGLAVYHCDTLGSNEWQGGTPDKHYQIGLLQADGHLDLERNRNRGDAGDLFGQVDGEALSHETIPHSRNWDGTDSGLTVSNITAPGATIGFGVGEIIDITIVVGTVTADLPIPDNDPIGVSSSIQISQPGRLKDIKVSVDIIHTWRGDLQVEIEAPSGEKVMLHRGDSGDQSDDIKKTYTTATTPALENLDGLSIEGIWKLNVRDEAPADFGRLNSWSIEIEYDPLQQIAEGEAEPDLPIPDIDFQGVSSVIAIAENGNLKDVTVGVEISHTFIRDLLVELISPSGHSVVLHNREGGSSDDIRTSYNRGSTPSLETLLGQPIQGDWVLRLKDLEAADAGVLEKWSLTLAF